LPATVVVPADAITASFAVTQAGATLIDTVTATLNSVMKTSMLSVDQHVVINEVDYDNINSDTAEFVELYNPSLGTLDLANLAVVFATNAGNETLRVPLSGQLGSHAYLVIGAASVAVPMGVIKINFANATNNIVNSPPTGVALIDTMALKVIDSVSF